VNTEEVRLAFLQQRRAVLGTADAAGVPHLVPVTYVQAGDHLYIAVDHKPKRTTDLKRLRNIAANPSVCLLIDHYDDDWTQLWWGRADGTATVTEFAALPSGIAELFAAKYPQYEAVTPEGPAVDIAVERWSGWAFAEP
jgi:PPOX class probable F420-dependent enzyme